MATIMTTVHTLGFPRIGAKRELKFALESYWQGRSSLAELENVGAGLRQRHWQAQSALDWVPVGVALEGSALYDLALSLKAQG